MIKSRNNKRIEKTAAKIVWFAMQIITGLSFFAILASFVYMIETWKITAATFIIFLVSLVWIISFISFVNNANKLKF